MNLSNYLLDALSLAAEAEARGEVPVGAVVVHDGKIIGRGSNHRESDNEPLGHAEIQAIQMAAKHLGSWRLNECELYVTLEPCLMCLGAAQQARVSRVIYGAKDEKGGAISLGYRPFEDQRLNHRFPVDFEETEACSQILKSFFLKRRNENKSAKLKA